MVLRFASLNSESLLFRRPGFNSQPVQTLGIHSFEALGPKIMVSVSFERSNQYLQGWRRLQKTGRADLVKLPKFSKTGSAAYSKYFKNW